MTTAATATMLVTPIMTPTAITTIKTATMQQT